MAESEEVIWTRLRNLDDASNLERPDGFDEEAAARRFQALVDHLERSFGCPCRTDAGPIRIQDASFYGDVFVPATGSRTGEELAIRVSNFGPMAVYAIQLFGAFDANEMADLLDPADQNRIERALLETGHLNVPEHLLWRVYDGRSDFWRTHFPDERPPTWWIRFFDWL